MLNKGVTYLMADDSRLGGRCYRNLYPIMRLLPLAVMTLHINPLSIDHPEMASYIRRFVSSIFAILAKALINANCKIDFNHSCFISKLRAWSGFSRVHRPIYVQKKQGLNLKFLPCYIRVGACLS